MAKRNGPYCGGKLHGREGTCPVPAGWGAGHRAPRHRAPRHRPLP
ncbi:MAG TPA: hypothetical protein VMV92_02300 [Streptosporangiaceae bacterium]|nr:hypothetical protein [Streptosporangiaceae bacterium]